MSRIISSSPASGATTTKLSSRIWTRLLRILSTIPSAQCDALLVVGTSLSTLSAFRLVEACAREGKPIALVTDGDTRAERAQLPGLLKHDARCGEVLASLADAIA